MIKNLHFVCPSCGAEHNRGYVDGVETFRCLRCGYLGFGFHADPETDREVKADARAAEAADIAAGLDPWPSPFGPPEGRP